MEPGRDNRSPVESLKDKTPLGNMNCGKEESVGALNRYREDIDEESKKRFTRIFR